MVRTGDRDQSRGSEGDREWQKNKARLERGREEMRAHSVEAYTALIASYQSIIHKSFSRQMLATQGWRSDREGTGAGVAGRDREREKERQIDRKTETERVCEIGAK